MPRKTNPKMVIRTKKIFVGGLSANTTLEDIQKYFEQFAKVREAMLAYDKITNRHRGFGQAIKIKIVYLVKAHL